MDAFDSTFLTFLFVPNAPCKVDRARERVDHFIGGIHGAGDRIIIPAPALSELLNAVGHSRKLILHELNQNPKFLIAPFDTRAALELALMPESLRTHPGKKRGDSGSTWAKEKFDWQIIAVSKVYGASPIYSEDPDIHKLEAKSGIKAKGVSDLPLPPKSFKGPTLFE